MHFWWLEDGLAVLEVSELVELVLLVGDDRLRAAMWVDSETGETLRFVRPIAA